MKRWILIVLLITFASPAQSLSWSYPFVVHDGNVYEVTEEEVINVGSQIGEVNRETEKMTGDYSGDASNVYPVGTAYVDIIGLPTDIAIAVETAPGQFQKAVYTQEAPYTWTDAAMNTFILITITAAIYLVGRGILRNSTYGSSV
ncbi:MULTISPECIES: hypothetical protein [Bacillaceae]|uniref:Uncharacterized protein n=1 Tax=Domibacillus aminovorans TaxID=29332 RepID=A0A177KR27_9BACI|nr:MULTISPECIES: hypothetical protein [Bacillaceae]OAH55790.1 hypothetical protein AWH48_03705 [Domibacillus aminovorans]